VSTGLGHVPCHEHLKLSDVPILELPCLRTDLVCCYKIIAGLVDASLMRVSFTVHTLALVA